MKANFSNCLPGLVSIIGCCLWCAAGAQTLQLVSAPNVSRMPPAGGGGDSYGPITSADGRYVLFASTANNLVALDGNRPIPPVTPAPLNVFLRDRTNGTTTLVSINSAGTGGANADCLPMGVSTNGRYALFESSASNLVSGDTNNAMDVFVRDLTAKQTVLVSSATAGGVANGSAQSSAMTPDGRFVAFLSDASNLVANDTNGIADVFVRDLQTGVTTLVSVGARTLSAGSPLTTWSAAFGTGTPDPAGITPDGRYVVFHSVATNLVAGLAFTDDIYVRDLVAGTTAQASAGARAVVAPGAAGISTLNYAISDSGQQVAYLASPKSGTVGVILYYDFQTGSTVVVNTNAPAGSPGSSYLTMTPDGRYLAFVANTNDSSGETTCVLVWDAHTGTSTLASGDFDGEVPIYSSCLWPALDASARFVTFLSDAPGLVTNDLVGDFHVYIRDLQSQTTKLVDADTNGVGSLLDSLPMPSLSLDGRFVAFEAPDGSLVPNDRNRAHDVFIRDLANGNTELISVHDPALPSVTPDSSSMLSANSVSADGRFVAFASEADDLAFGDTNAVRDIFLRDLSSNVTTLVSISTNGVPGDSLSTEPGLSADGRYVVFSSYADDLVSGDTNRSQDVFLRDLQADTTILISINAAGTGPGNKDSYAPQISTDGRRVLFRSRATNLAPGSFSGSENLFLRDLSSGVTRALTTRGVVYAAMTPDGRFTAFVTLANLTSPGPLYIWDAQTASLVYTNTILSLTWASFSPDGQRLLYWMGTGGLYALGWAAKTNSLVAPGWPASPALPSFSADGRYLAYAVANGIRSGQGTNQVYLYDFQTGSNLLVSQSWSTGAPGDADSDSPAISADGRWVAYRSSADNLVPGDANGTPDVFLWDRLSGDTRLVSASRFQNASADNRSLVPLISSDGRTVFFESWASDLCTNDFNSASDVFAFSVGPAEAASAFALSVVPSGQGCWMTWPVQAGRTYRVQYKNALQDATWQDDNGGVAVVGNTGYLSLPWPGSPQRFYRVLAY